MSYAVLTLSTVLQFCAAGLAVRLIWVTGRKRAWSLIALAMILMGVRRAITLYHGYVGDAPSPPDLSAELVALAISVLMVAGVALIGPLFADIRKTHAQLAERERKVQDFAEAASDWFWEMDADLRFTFFSDRKHALTGLSPHEFIGMTRWEVAGGDPDTDDTWRRHRATMEARDPFRDFQYEYRAADGRRRVASVNGKPVFDRAGTFIGYRGTATDITDQRQAQAALEESRRMLHAVIDSLPAMINAKDRNSRYVFMNHYQAELYGITPDDAIGRTATDLLGDEYGGYTQAIDAQVLETNLPKQNYEETWVDRDGKVRHLLTTKVPLHGDRGHATHVVTVALDITERIRAEEERRAALIAAEDANRAKSEFLAAISHDLRTPLNAILGFAQILSHQYLGPLGSAKYLEYAGDICTSGEFLLELVNDILDISAIEAGKRSLVKESVSVPDAIAECTKAVAGNAEKRGVAISADGADNLPPVYAEKRAVKQILLNLMTNAVKFTPQGGSVSVSAEAADRAVVLRVADTGIGIEPERIDTLMAPFERGSDNPYVAQDGTGLGLAITQSLVELHKGTLTIDSEPGRGTTVTVRLPSEAP